MKKKYLLFLIALFAIVISCTDKSLDPLQFDKIKKGTLLVLRGDALQNLYFDGAPIAVAAPEAVTGNETFEYDAMYLAADPKTLASIDIFVIKGSGANTSRVLMTNIPASTFSTDGTYTGPWTHVSLKFFDILTNLGLDNTLDSNGKLPAATVTALLHGDYKFGINIETDVNLTDGSKVPASDIVASGLFQSDQFYPAMKLNYPMIGFCPLDMTTWAGTYVSVEAPGSTEDNKVTRDADVINHPNRLHMDNFWGDGPGNDVYWDMLPSTSPFDQVINVPDQTSTEGGQVTQTAPGSYDQCTGSMVLKVAYTIGGATYKFTYSLSPK